MIGKEELKNLIQSYYKQDDRVNKLCEIFTDAFDNPILNWGIQMFEAVIEAYFNDKGCDWIFYYLYENPEKCYYDESNKRIPLETIDDLWELIKNYRI